MTQEHEAPKLSGYLFGRYASLIYLAGAAAAIWYRNVRADRRLRVSAAAFRADSALAQPGAGAACAGTLDERGADLRRRDFHRQRLGGQCQMAAPRLDGMGISPIRRHRGEEDRREPATCSRRSRAAVAPAGVLDRAGRGPEAGRIRSRAVHPPFGDGFASARPNSPITWTGGSSYPRLVPVKAPPFPHSLQWSAGGRRGGLHEDRLMLAGVREYEAGAEWRRINWKASARTGKLQINLYEPIVDRQLLFYLDVRGFVPPPGARIRIRSWANSRREKGARKRSNRSCR